MQDGLSQEQVALVLRRAAELDRHLGSPAEPGLDEAAVEQAALEAGLSRPAVRQALAEHRAGLLAEPPARRRGLLGPAALTVCRTVPGPYASVEHTVHLFLHNELFELRRDYGCRTTWVRRRGLEATTRRAVDRATSRRLILRDAHHVDVSLVDQSDEWVTVRLDVDVLSIRHAQGTVAGSAAVAGGGIAAGSLAGAAAHPVFLLITAGGVAIASIGQRAGRSVYRRRAGEIESNLGGLLDRLERGVRPPPGRHDRQARLA